MRPLVLALFVGLLLAAALPGQEPAIPVLKPGQGKPDVILDTYLKKWEERNAKLTGLVGTCRFTEIDEVGKKEVYSGEFTALRPNYATLFLKLESDPTSVRKWKHYVADGKEVWILDHQQKMAVAKPLGEGSHPMFALLVGMKAADLKKRFELSVEPDNETKFNKNYMHIGLEPKTKEDEQEFKKAELVLWKNDEDAQFTKNFMLPARLWFQSPNGSQTMWEFKGLTPKALAKDNFAVPKLAADWKIERAKKPEAKPAGDAK